MNEELKTMRRLIGWCNIKNYPPDRIRQLIIDWHKASNEPIPKELFEKELNMEDDW